MLSRDGKLVFTEKAKNSSVAIMYPNGSNRGRVFEADTAGLDPRRSRAGWPARSSRAGPRRSVGRVRLGEWFRRATPATHGSCVCAGTARGWNPSPTARCIRGSPVIPPTANRSSIGSGATNNVGLRVLNLADRSTRVLTTAYDDLPAGLPTAAASFHPSRGCGRLSTFSRFGRMALTFCGSPRTGRPTVTQSGPPTAGSCGTAASTASATRPALYDNTFQQYGQIFIMNADGSGKRMLTDSRWEDLMPLYIPAKFL